MPLNVAAFDLSLKAIQSRCTFMCFEQRNSRVCSPPVHLSLMLLHLNTIFVFSGTVTESDEMRPEWYDIHSIPYHQMWLDDQYWLPLLLAGRTFVAKFVFRGQDVITSQFIRTDVGADELETFQG
jgi:hypothetical protein